LTTRDISDIVDSTGAFVVVKVAICVVLLGFLSWYVKTAQRTLATKFPTFLLLFWAYHNREDESVFCAV
jgi:hypothetical protein